MDSRTAAGGIAARRRSTGGASPALDAADGGEDARRIFPGATALFSLSDGGDDSETPSPYFTRRPLAVGERGVSSVQFVLASALALVLFLALANLVVVQYGKGAIRSALEQGARAGTTGGAIACEESANRVVEDLLGGRMSDGLALSCSVSGGSVVATASAVFESWTPLTPDFSFTLSSAAVMEQ